MYVHRYGRKTNVGIEILHQFVLDLLPDRNSASIFKAKARESFEYYFIVNQRVVKNVVLVIVMTFKIAFVVYSILLNGERSLPWQISFMVSS